MLQSIKAMKSKCLVLLLLIGGCSPLLSQVAPAAYSRSEAGAFVSFGGLRTHVIAFTYNALGVDGGLFTQKSPLIGVEVRGGSFPFYARYSQSPFTGGYRAAMHLSRFHDTELFGYFGGGMSLAQDAGPHYVATSAQWSPCWQASQGANIPVKGHLQWKAYEGTWTETYTSLRSLRGLSLTTGITYSF
jgi:hypothetical protein